MLLLFFFAECEKLAAFHSFPAGRMRHAVEWRRFFRVGPTGTPFSIDHHTTPEVDRIGTRTFGLLEDEACIVNDDLAEAVAALEAVIRGELERRK